MPTMKPGVHIIDRENTFDKVKNSAPFYISQIITSILQTHDADDIDCHQSEEIRYEVEQFIHSMLGCGIEDVRYVNFEYNERYMTVTYTFTPTGEDEIINASSSVLRERYINNQIVGEMIEEIRILPPPMPVLETYPPECEDDIYFMLYGTRQEMIEQLDELEDEAAKAQVSPPTLEGILHTIDHTKPYSRARMLKESYDKCMADNFDRAMKGI